MNGLEIVELKQPSLADRMLRRKPKDNALLEIQNYLASTPISQMSSDIIQRQLKEYRVTLQEAKEAFVYFYTKVLSHFLSDREISEDEAADLQHLRAVLDLSDEDIRAAEGSIILPLYERAVKDALSDHYITDKERAYLDSLQQRLGISEKAALTIRQSHSQEIFQNAIDRIVADRRVSPEEEMELKRLADGLGGSIKFDEASLAQLERFRLLWRISQGDIPEIEVDIHLQRGEKCFAAAGANHYNVSTVTTAVRYHGPSASIKIMKGVRWRVGQTSVHRVTEDRLKLLDSGVLYITNKRVLFDGSKKTTSINLNKILNYKLYQDALVVEKDSGKDQIFEFASDAEIIGAVLEYVSAETRS